MVYVPLSWQQHVSCLLYQLSAANETSNFAWFRLWCKPCVVLYAILNMVVINPSSFRAMGFIRVERKCFMIFPMVSSCLWTDTCWSQYFVCKRKWCNIWPVCHKKQVHLLNTDHNQVRCCLPTVHWWWTLMLYCLYPKNCKLAIRTSDRLTIFWENQETFSCFVTQVHFLH